MTSPGRLTIVLCLTICLAAACSTVRETVESAKEKPTIARAAQMVAVSEVSERAGYLEATLGTEVPLRLYFAANEPCRVLLEGEKEVEYRGLGTFGEVAGSAGTCAAQGTATLRAWHNRQLTRRTAAGKPREVARFTKTYEDDSVLMIRGRFPLAVLINMMADDVVAILPARSDCRSLIERGEGFMEYQRSIGPVFHLTGGETRCEFLGLAQPLRK